VNLPDLVSAAEDARALNDINAWLEARSPQDRVHWALSTLPGEHALSSSFGVQSAAILHLVTCEHPEIPVLLIDTGYLFPETYRFADELTERLGLNLKVYPPALGVAWMEARHGRLWEQGMDGIERYNRLRKIEPMKRALRDIGAHTWIAGLRRTQSQERKAINVLELREGRWKFHPVADWTDQDVWNYLQSNNLPTHPLSQRGYTSVGDVHTTNPLEPGMRAEETRFFGLKRECGLHFDV
jgi:phosphoadenosine phosphosulfate reductase